MRICIINPFAGTEFFGRENLEAIAAPGTEFDMVNIEARYPLTNNQWLFFKHSCTGPTIDRAIEAERQTSREEEQLDFGYYELPSRNRPKWGSPDVGRFGYPIDR